MALSDCRLIDLPEVKNRNGNLTFVEGMKHLPFDIKRAFFIYNVPEGGSRGAHAHRLLEEAVVCISGSMEVVMTDGRETRGVRLDKPFSALYIPPLIWSSMENFSRNTVYLVLASMVYDESDYIRDYGEFVRMARGIRQVAAGD